MEVGRVRSDGGVSRALVEILFLSMLLSATLVGGCAARSGEGEGLTISVPFTNISSERETIRVPLEVENNLNRSLLVSFEVLCPEGWAYSLVLQGYNVSEIFLEPNEGVDLSFRLEPGEGVGAGSHTFAIRAVGDGVSSNRISITVRILRPIEEVELKATRLSVTGSPGSIFTFRFDIANKSYRDLTFSLFAKIPSGWYLLGFKPSAYERRAISEITVEAQSTKRGVVAEVWCPEEALPGEYPVTVIASGEDMEMGLEFTAAVTGTYKVSLGTEEGLLSYRVNAGESKEIILVVQNEGTADLVDVKVSCSAPRGWRAVVSPERVDIVRVGRSERVSLVVSPPAGTIAGDYSVTARVRSREGSDEIKLRITVTKPTLWGVIGLVVVVGSVFGLMLAFRKYGRP